MNICLQAEINWINKNVDRYDSPLHAMTVIANISKRYALIEVKRLIASYNETRNTKDQLELFEWLTK